MACAAENIIPCTVELGGKSPNIYFADVMDGEDEFIEKAVEGWCWASSTRVKSAPAIAGAIHESIYEPFMERVMAKVAQIRRGDPFDTDTMIGAQASRQQFDKILSYIKIARDEAARSSPAASAPASPRSWITVIYSAHPDQGRNDMRSFQEEIFGPVIGITTFKDEAEALAIANETQFGLGPASGRAILTWPIDGRGIKAGRVWTNCYHVYPAHAAFGGYKQSGVGRETHKMALNAYQQTKNLLVSYGTAPLGLF
ncbi:Acetaldehyde dehydrogenase 2 [Raoultella terrigena]|uniref:Acetaldehyde dehydrogenase 2 n=1 Tax=Raoultella terrigena TaxID=577 RepID=A0A4U9CYN6_RAOTE|nr:Acetaldehyde dehydrogenase 2 [Raoultella terrigena]